MLMQVGRWEGVCQYLVKNLPSASVNTGNTGNICNTCNTDNTDNTGDTGNTGNTEVQGISRIISLLEHPYKVQRKV